MTSVTKHAARCALVMLFAWSAPGTAQEPVLVPQPQPSVLVPDPQPSVVGPIIGGLVGGAVGLYGGAYLGYQLECADGCPGMFGGLGGLFLGAIIGESVLMPVGVHLGNGSRGLLWRGIGGSLLMALPAAVLAPFTEGVSLLAMPLVQLGLTVAIERSTAAERAEPGLSLGVAPTPSGGLAAVGSLRF